MESPGDEIIEATLVLPQIDVTKPPPAPKKTGARDPRLVWIGIYIAVAGFIPAIILAAIMGSQPNNQWVVLEQFHNVTKLIILAGFVTMLVGYMHFDAKSRRPAERTSPADRKKAVPFRGPFAPPPSAPR